MAKVTMPQLGESVAEGTIGRWLKQVGDHVDKYEPIVEVVTDKVNAEVPSPFEGTLSAILVQEGETVANDTEIAVIDGSGEAPAETATQPSPTASASVASPTPSSAVSMTAISALFGTVEPSSARISRRVPSNGDGTSALTLSVITSSRGSYLST